MYSKHIFLLVSCLMLAACDNDSAENTQAEPLVRPALIVPVQSYSLLAKRIFPATLEASQHSDLAFRVSGQLAELPVKAGDHVKKGDVLAKLEQSDFKNALSDRQARYDLAKTQYSQIQSLLDKKYASQNKLDEVKANLKAATAALSLARDNLDYTVLTAPFDGVVARVDIQNYQSVKAQSPIILLQDQHDIDVLFSVPEMLLTRLKPGISAQGLCGDVSFESRPDKTYQACYRKYESIPDPATRTYPVVFTMPKQSDITVLPGMSVSIEIDLSAILADVGSNHAMQIPLSAVFENKGESFVWRVNAKSQAEQVPVTILSIQDNSLIVEGLSSDDRVIAAGVAYVQAGQVVRPIEKERGL